MQKPSLTTLVVHDVTRGWGIRYIVNLFTPCRCNSLLCHLQHKPTVHSTHRLADLCQYIFGTLEQPNLDLSDYFEPLHLAVNNQILLIFNYNTLAKIQLTFFLCLPLLLFCLCHNEDECSDRANGAQDDENRGKNFQCRIVNTVVLGLCCWRCCCCCCCWSRWYHGCTNKYIFTLVMM